MGTLRVFKGLSARLRPQGSLLGACALACACAVVLPAGASAAECANEARRVEQNATFLPDCRAYERVSPEAKGGGDIVGDGDTVIAGNLGEEAFRRGEGAVAFNTRTAFGDTVGTGVDGQATYVARRGGAGWASHAATPAGKPEALQALFLMTKLELFSDDLTRGVVWGYDLPGGGGTPDRGNIYDEEIATHHLQAITVSQVPPYTYFPGEFIPFGTTTWGMSADGQHVALVSGTQMLSNAAPGAQNVYQWDAGKGLSVAGVLPDGTVSESGSEAVFNGFGGTGWRGAMSADGSRLLFMSTPKGFGQSQLYMRIDGERTAWISESENTSETVEPAEVHIQDMTPNGNSVFFVTSSKLLSEDTNNGPDLYRWTYGPDPEHEKNLTLVTNNGSFALWPQQPIGVIGASDDGTRVYYQTIGSHLVVWDNGTSTTISEDLGADPSLSVAAVASSPGYGRVSSDGSWLAFGSRDTLNTDGVHGLTGTVTDDHLEMYMYSLKENRLVCVSCPAGPATSDASITPDVTNSSISLTDTAIRPEFLSGNGRVFFSTVEALVPQDTNGVEDVYEYDGETGKLSLLSPGTTGQPTSFGDASANGEDVFVLTRGRLVSEDRDPLVDLYDVRTNGGFPAPVSGSACVADECQSQPSPAPGFTIPASVGFAGAGNLPASASKPAASGQARAQRLAKALRACRRKHGRVKRRQCEARARGRYGKNAKTSSRGSK